MAQDNSKATAFSSVPDADSSRLLNARKHALVRKEADRENGVERERLEHLGGLQLQMSVRGTIPGYHLFWENDENGAIEQLLQEGFDFVTQDELQDQQAKIVPDIDITSVMSRFVKGTRVDGSALRAFLLKCPDDVWANRERIRHKAADEWDKQIRAQAETPTQGLRKLKGLDSTVDTGYRKEY